MLLSHRYKFITIDIPKTGSRSLRESLTPLGVVNIHGEAKLDSEFYQHDHASRVQKQFVKNDWDWNDYFKFTVVRNPWARYFSFFKYFKSYGEKYLHRDQSIDWGQAQLNQGKLCVKLFENKDDQTILKNIILNNDAQDSYYCDTNDEIIVDHIASFENLENEFVFLCNRLEINAPHLQHGNKSSQSQNMHEIYNQQLIDLVAQKEKSVIELKGYNFK